MCTKIPSVHCSGSRGPQQKQSDQRDLEDVNMELFWGERIRGHLLVYSREVCKIEIEDNCRTKRTEERELEKEKIALM